MNRAARLFVWGLSAALPCAFGVPAQADWLSAPSRAISVADSASPDAPVTAYEYGPRARASLGGDWAIFSTRSRDTSFRLGGSALISFEDATDHAFAPSQALRTAFELSAAWAFTNFAARSLGRGRTLELALAVGKHTTEPVHDFTLPDRYHADDVPFGAGGGYLSAETAFFQPLGDRWEQFSRLGFRAYTNAFPDLVGARVASDAVADDLHEGAEYQAFCELGLRVHALPRLEPLARLYFDVIAPHDDSAKPLVLARLLVGAAVPGSVFELTPFTAVEVGHGEGIVVNRTELRWSGGVRLYAR